MNPIWPIAVITFKEGTRNRAFYGISIIALLLMLAAFLLSGMIMRDVGKVAVDMALSTVSFAGLLLVLFVGIDLMAKDLDKRTIYMVLARPISRQQYIFGKFIGIALLILTTVFILSLFGEMSIVLIKWANPNYFPRFAWGPVFLAEAFIALSLMIISALSVLFASFSSSSFITLVLTILSYLIGQSTNSVKAIVDAPGSAGITVSPVTVKLVQAAYYTFPNLSLFDLKTRAAHGLSVPVTYLFWTLLYGIVYICLVTLFASIIFKKKEFF
jgi:Cu-processing system permease protein